MKYTFSLFIITLLSLSASAQLPAPVWKINTIAGDGIQSFGGDGLTSTAAGLSGPFAIGLDTLGNYYILDYYNLRVRKVNSGTIITTVAGSGTGGNSGDNGIATNATMNPRGMAVSKGGDIYISDDIVGVIRKVNHNTGIITRYAGTGVNGYSGDGGPATAAQLNEPYGMVLDGTGNLFVAEAGNHTIRKITPSGTITTVAGDDTAGYSGDLGPATAARLDSPYAVTVDRIGNLYISDRQNDVIRKVDTAGKITTYAGTYNVHSRIGDGGPAVLATINAPAGLTIDSIGNLYICDADNHVIRKVDTFKNISTIVGLGTQGFTGDLGLATACLLNTPFDIAVDKQGSLYIADANAQRVRKVYNATLGVTTVLESNISIYPNPASTYVTLSGLAVADKVVIYDMTGRQVTQTWDVTTTTQTFSLSPLAPGTYNLQVWDHTGTKKASAQLVKE